MALTFSTDVRDQVCLILRGRVYSALNSPDQTAIAGTHGAGPRALAKIQRWAHFLQMDGSDTAPDGWERWLIHEAANEAATFLRPEIRDDLRRAAIDAQRDALQTYTRAEIDGTAPNDVATDDIGAVRRYIVSRCARLDPVCLPEPDIVDSCIKDVLTRLWNDADWKFTQRVAVLTIATDQTVTAKDEADGDITVDRIVDQELRYNNGQGSCLVVDRDEILRWRSRQDPSTGQPLYVHLQKNGSDIQYLFEPKPDQQYVVRATVKVRTPTMTNASQLTTAIASFPHEFQPLIRRFAHAQVLLEMGRREGQVLLARVEEDLAALAPDYDSPGGEPERSREGLWLRRGLGNTGAYFGGWR